MKEIIAAIDVGSHALRMKIGEVNRSGEFKELESFRKIAVLGHDTFTKGKIDFESVDQVCELLKLFKRSFADYGVSRYQAVGTSAIREASNRDYIVDQIMIKTGLDIRVISNSEEQYLTHKAVKSHLKDYERLINEGAIIVVVGAGSIQITTYKDGRLQSSQNVKMGALRIREVFNDLEDRSLSFYKICDEYISSSLEDIDLFKDGKVYQHLIAVGGEISVITKIIEEQKGKESDVFRIIDNNFKKITYNANYLIDKLANEIDNDLFFMSITENEFNALYYLIVGSQELENEIYSLPKKIDCDLQGHDTWESLSSVFRILNLSSEWVVLRNYEDLSDDYKFGPDDDIDILCRNIDIFTAIINAKKRTGGRCSYYVSVNNFNIPLDIRFIGDKYYDPVWQNNMIKTKVYYNNIPVLDMYNYFFALLYHIKLQKFFIKEAYIERLDNLADELNIKDLASKFIYDDKKCAELLNGFLLTNSYYYTYTDNARRNKFFLKYIKYVEINDLLDNYRVLIPSIIKVFMTKGFGKIKRLINKIIKKDINNAI